MDLTCERCKHRGPIEEFPENLTSVHNANRCPRCGSTQNAYNSAHSTLMSAVFNGKRQGPVTHSMVLEQMRVEGST
jgi:hypothetical protein